MPRAARYLLHFALLLCVTINARAGLGPDERYRKRWDGRRDNFWLQRLPAEFEEVRAQLRVLGDHREAGRNGTPTADTAARARNATKRPLEDETMRGACVRVMDVLAAMETTMRFRFGTADIWGINYPVPSLLGADVVSRSLEAEEAAYALGMDPCGLISQVLAIAGLLAETKRAEALPIIARLSYFIGPQIGAADDAPNPSPALRLDGVLFSFGLPDLPKFDVDRYRSDLTYRPATELVMWIQNDPRFQWAGGPPEFANYFPVAGNPMPGGSIPPRSEPPTTIDSHDIFSAVLWVVGLGLAVALFYLLRPAKTSKVSRLS